MIINPYIFGGEVVGGFGYLYNRYATNDPLFVPASGDWAIPAFSHYQTLIGDTDINGIRKVGAEYWNWSGYTDSSGFSAVGAGTREVGVAHFLSRAVLPQSDGAGGNYTLVIADGGFLQYYPLGMDTGVSVRLVYVGGGTPGSTMQDYDGNIYEVVQIGTQYWTKQNWKCERLNDGTLIPYTDQDSTWSGATTMLRTAPNNNLAII